MDRNPENDVEWEEVILTYVSTLLSIRTMHLIAVKRAILIETVNPKLQLRLNPC